MKRAAIALALLVATAGEASADPYPWLGLDEDMRKKFIALDEAAARQTAARREELERRYAPVEPGSRFPLMDTSLAEWAYKDNGVSTDDIPRKPGDVEAEPRDTYAERLASNQAYWDRIESAAREARWRPIKRAMDDTGDFIASACKLGVRLLIAGTMASLALVGILWLAFIIRERLHGRLG